MVVNSKEAALEGQVYSLPVKNGFGYFQALFHVKKWGFWIKVYRGVHTSPQLDLNEIANVEHQFYTFFPLSQAIKSGAVRLVGLLPIASSDRVLPKLKTPGGILRDGTVTDWFIVDGDSTTRVRRLSDDEKRLQDQMVLNDSALADMIAEGWTPESSVHVRKSL